VARRSHQQSFVVPNFDVHNGDPPTGTSNRSNNGQRLDRNQVPKLDGHPGEYHPREGNG
jgi:hypothetical protein